MAGKSQQAAMEAFVAEHGVDAFPHTIDDDGSIWERFDVRLQPAFAFIDDDGTITLHRGALGTEGIASQIEALQAQ